jgi:hypothetical protein
MSADYSDMLAKIQLAMAQQNTNPSFAGLQAPVDPSRMQNLLNSLRQQQFLQQSDQPTPGPYGYLHDAGKQGFVQAGQQIGNLIGNAIGAAPAPRINPMQQPQAAPGGGQASPVDGSAPNAAPSSPQAPGGGQAAYSAAIVKAKQAYSSMVTAGVDPNIAKVNSLKMLVAAGIPGADTQLEEANSAVLKNQSTQAETAKNVGEAGSYQSNAQNQQFDQSTKQWKTTFTDPNGLYLIQTNGQGQQQRVELKPPPTASAQAAANLSPDSIQFAADTYRSTGKFPGSFGRSPAMQAVVLNKISQDALANGDTAGSIAARSAALKANGTALDQITKQETLTSGAVATLDSNLKSLQALGQKLDTTGSPLINRAVTAFNQGVAGDPDTAAYVSMLNAVQSEYAKIASNNNGNSPISDSAKADAKEVINKLMSQGGIAAVAQAMRTESANRLQAIRDTKTGLIGTMSGNAPSANGPAVPSGGGQQPPARSSGAAPGASPGGVRTYNPQTGTFQ